MMERFEEETVRYLYLMQVIEAPARRTPQPVLESGGNGGTMAAVSAAARQQRMATTIDDMEAEFQRRKRRELDQARMAGSGDQGPVQQVVRGDKVGRNDPCPCGSGKKYKKCCGA
jgi:preprotein translocase subunit SecA